ncbi:hypothetical protein CRENPOLYSF2_2900002 [Crenothrix polyspora]|uniref:Uncharacterized protein n=1 Tax=Crenothrix polyspora TaxID=360316 RepID=A0A1R4H9Q5_9GAMM|nr:hypothetical protein CRENPOLYSF2_2900002 [Crenothrix polyspora]
MVLPYSDKKQAPERGLLTLYFTQKV